MKTTPKQEMQRCFYFQEAQGACRRKYGGKRKKSFYASNIKQNLAFNIKTNTNFKCSNNPVGTVFYDFML